MAKLYKIVEDNKADKGVRLANYLIDFVAVYLLFVSFFLILGIIHGLTGNADIGKILYSLADIDPIIDRIVSFLTYAILMFILEYTTKGRSLGKLITGTMVVKTDSTILTATDYFIRNMCRIIPFEALSYLGSTGWHDSISNTRVVKKRAYEEAQMRKIDLESLGTPDPV